jgi:hypothetical protein
MNKRLSFIDCIKSVLILFVLSGKAKKKQANFFALIDLFSGLDSTFTNAFFVLNSLFLTHRLMYQLKGSTTIKQDILIIFKYFIRRLFRVHLILLVTRVCIRNKYFDFATALRNYYAGFTDFFFVESIFGSFELIFELFIPIFCILALREMRALPIILVTNYFYNNSFYQTLSDSDMRVDQSQFTTGGDCIFCRRFKSLLYGSIAAYALFLCDRSVRIKRLLRKRLLRFLLAVCCCCIIVYGLTRDGFNSVFIWPTFYFLIILSHPNQVTGLFEQANYLKVLGFYGFGIFFFHPVVVTLVHDYITPNKQREHFSLLILLSFLQSFLFTVLVQNRLIKFGEFLCSRVDFLFN